MEESTNKTAHALRSNNQRSPNNCCKHTSPILLEKYFQRVLNAKLHQTEQHRNYSSLAHGRGPTIAWHRPPALPRRVSSTDVILRTGAATTEWGASTQERTCGPRLS